MSAQNANHSPRLTIRVDPMLATQLTDVVEDGPYMDESEFMREAIRSHIRRVGGNEDDGGLKRPPKKWRDRP